jgi:tetratricopeptide (TPR) repeat protein
LGKAYSALEQYNDALLQYEHAVHIDPTNNEYLAAKGVLYCQAPPDKDLLDRGIEILEQCSQHAPDDDDIRNNLAVAYIAKAHEDWVRDPEDEDARYATRIEHIEKAKPYIDKAAALKIADKALANMIVTGKDAVRNAEKRKFVGRYRPGILTIFISTIALSFGGFSIFWFLYLIFGVLYFFALRRPGYVTNQKAFEGGDKPSILDRIMAPIYDVAGGITFYGPFLSNLRKMFLLRGVIDLIRDALSMLFLPVETIKGLLENYDLKGLISRK